MTTVYEMKAFKFEHDPILQRLVRDLAEAGTMTVQEMIDAAYRAGFDGRATATEIGILLMDGELKPAHPTERTSGGTVVEPVVPSRKPNPQQSLETSKLAAFWIAERS
ncbi:hypothetical protein M9978_19935 [Sphingomonas sp. MG17]|uniref:Uncharacterized protein n=1 Tax=Sphingomonas tagetis TaxID=2949092 RepID=A0A9X2HSI8_9SPHN|nr:hypothetical protein [Sphingomonas tagetis]MCP3732693.1 hypothetical protein [Sphingomonas tagetis]